MATAQSLSHVWPLGTTLNPSGHIEVGGCDLVALAREVGTPAYIVAEDDLRARARAFREAFAAQAPGVHISFATKAFPCAAVLRLLAEEGVGADVASGGELAIALRAGVDPSQITLHGNAKSERELLEALDAGVGLIVIDNADELTRLERLADRAQDVMIRVAPDVRGDTHDHISTGQADTKFGFSLADAPAAMQRIRASGHLHLRGVHLHIGSQLSELDPFRRAIAAVASLGPMEAINVGGGLAVAYSADQHTPSPEEYAAAKVGAIHEHLGTDVAILDEPGRALVAGAGVTIYSVQSVKRNISTWVGVDGGMSDNLRPMLYGARYEAVLASRPGGSTRCHVVGKHCESSDVLVRDAVLDDPRVGDIVVTPVTGAYCYAMSNQYNAVTRPPVVFVRDGEARVVVRRETYDDLLSRDVL
ncbi:MAG: diaminopimelate decarboxylase [Solirubrobacteraceae bacterium]|nr:diaminopimelate decarboxylase [Solirubrobacteraceae bacterium]